MRRSSSRTRHQRTSPGPRGSIVVDDDPLALAQRRVGRHKRSSRNRKGRSLAFALLELRHSRPRKRCQLLSPISDCSRNIATHCYLLKGVDNTRSAGIVRRWHTVHGPPIAPELLLKPAERQLEARLSPIKRLLSFSAWQDHNRRGT